MFRNSLPWRFILLTFGFSWTIWLLLASTGLDINESLIGAGAYIFGGFGPMLGGVVMVYQQRDQAYQVDYWRRLLDFRRIKAGWWLVLLFIFPAAMLLALFVVSLVSPDAVDLNNLGDFFDRSPALIVLHVFFIVIVGPLSEEPGWRGYAQDWLQERYSPLTTSIILSVMWWAWHLPLIGVVGSFLYGDVATPGFMAGYFGTVFLYSVLFTWVYNHNERSVLAVIILHFSINLTSNAIAPPFVVLMATTFVLIGISLFIIYRDKMWQFDGLASHRYQHQTR